MQLTINNHGFSNGDRIKLGNNSLTFTCGLDSNATQHSYPRTSDPAGGGDWLAISQVATNTFEVNVGASSDTSAHSFVSSVTGGLTHQDGTVTINVGPSPSVEYTPTNATYDPATGLLEMTIGTHNLNTGQSVKLTNEGITFTCLLDGNATQHSYPRANGQGGATADDPAYLSLIHI